MRRYKIIPRVLLILSIINFALAAPVPVPEVRQACADVVARDGILMSDSAKRGDLLVLEEPLDKYLYDRWRKRGPSSASSPGPAPSGAGAVEPADDQTLTPAPDSPPSPQTGTSGIQQQTSPSSSGIKRPSPSEEDYLSSGEGYQASNEGGPGSSEDGYSSSGSNTALLAGSGSTSKGYSSAIIPAEVGPGIISSHSTSNLPLWSGSMASKGHLTSWDVPAIANMPVPPVKWLNPQPRPKPPGPVPDRNNPLYWGGAWSSTSSELDVVPKKNFISGFFSNVKTLLSTLFSKSKDFLSMLVGKFRFWRRTSES